MTLVKRPRLSENNSMNVASGKDRTTEDVKEVSNAVPDVADAIEDLLAQSNKVLLEKKFLRNMNDWSIWFHYGFDIRYTTWSHLEVLVVIEVYPFLLVLLFVYIAFQLHTRKFSLTSKLQTFSPQHPIISQNNAVPHSNFEIGRPWLSRWSSYNIDIIKVQKSLFSIA